VLERDVALVLKYKSLAEPSNKFSPLDDTKAKLSKPSSPILWLSPTSISPVTSIPDEVVASLSPPSAIRFIEPVEQVTSKSVPLVKILLSKSSEKGVLKSIKAPDEPPTSIEPKPELFSTLIELSASIEPVTSIPVEVVASLALVP